MKRPGMAGWLAWPPLLYLAVFFVVPVGMLAAYSVRERDVYGQVTARYSAEGWQEATGPIAREVLARSLLLAGGVTLACVLAGYPCAMALAGLPPGRRRVLVALLAFPLITSLLLRVYGWMNLLPLGWRGTTGAVGLVMTANYLPFMVLPLLRAWERLDPALVHAALDLGATPGQAFWRVTWPLTRPGLWAGCALVFIPAAGEYLVPHFIGEGKVQVLGTLIVQQFMDRRNWPFAAAASVWLLALVALPVVVSAGAGRDRA